VDVHHQRPVSTAILVLISASYARGQLEIVTTITSVVQGIIVIQKKIPVSSNYNIPVSIPSRSIIAPSR